MALHRSVTLLPTSKVGCQRPPCGRARGRACPDFPSALQGMPYPALPRGHSLPVCLWPPPCGLSACPLWSSRTKQSGGHTLAQCGGPGPPQRRRRGGGGAAQLGGPDQRDQPRAGPEATLLPGCWWGLWWGGGAGQQAGLGPEQLGPVDSAQSLCGAQGLQSAPPPPASCGRAGRPGAIAWPEGAPALPTTPGREAGRPPRRPLCKSRPN